MKKILLIAAVCILTASAGCYNDNYQDLYPPATTTTVTCDTTAVSFANDVLPILNANCNIAGGCHNAAGLATSGYDFTTFGGIQPVATYSILVDDIMGTPTRGNVAMPLNLPKISQCDINIITAWVDQGAHDN